MILVPPWEGASYGLIFDPPHGATEIDYNRLGIQLVLVGIACGAIYLALPNNPAAVPLKTSTHSGAWLSKKSLFVTLALLTMVSIPLGWKAYEQLQAKLAADAEVQRRQENEKAESLRLAEVQEEGYRRDEERRRELAEERDRIDEQKRLAAEQQRLAEEELRRRQRQEQLATFAHYKKLATTKSWTAKGSPRANVKTVVHTYWKDSQIFFRLELKGPPETLEYTLGEHPMLSISMVNKDAQPVTNFSFEAAELIPKRGKNGGITSMTSRNRAAACAMDTYESLASAHVQY